jgi:mono/diheme cytochrome c family protein
MVRAFVAGACSLAALSRLAALSLPALTQLAAFSLAALNPLAAVHAQQAASTLPPGEGRDIVAVACTQCHGPSAFTQLRVGPEGWRFQVYDMVLRGAQVRPSEMDQVVSYLSTNFGPGINVPPPVAQVTLPEGAGQELVAQRCSLCHGLDRVVAARRTPTEWEAIMSRMVFLGAPAAGDDGKRITSYLEEKLGTK